MDILGRTVILLTNHNPLLNYIWTTDGNVLLKKLLCLSFQPDYAEGPNLSTYTIS